MGWRSARVQACEQSEDGRAGGSEDGRAGARGGSHNYRPPNKKLKLLATCSTIHSIHYDLSTE